MTVVRAETIVELLEQSSSVLYDEHGSGRTCGDMLASGRALAVDLAAAGIGRGDRIAVQMQNSELYVDVLVAAAVGGFVVMSVNTRFAPALADSIIERAGARMVIRGATDLPPRVDRDPEFATRTADERFVIFTTSGTTSAPKLVVHQQRSITAHAADVAEAFGYHDESVIMLPVPLCGVFGFTVLWGALAGHSTVYMPTAFDAEQTGRLVQEHGVTSMHGSDDMFHRLLATDWDLSTIRSSGYARFNSALDGIVERCEARGVPLAGLYGMSEVQALYAFRGASGLPMEQRWRAAGELVSPQAERRVVDDELQLQGPSLFEGYLADGGAEIDHELTAANFDGPWFKTGDLAVEDGPRSFEYITRIGDVMRLGGFLVAPVEVEGAIMRLDEIDQAQVVAVSLAKGARPVAFVILAAGAQLDEQAVIDHCAETLARFKCPVRVVAVDEFPVTDGPNGVKIQRNKLREMGAALLTP
ncbi:MAG: fatty-acyl-CoA synthase [Acidimicrobiales bacterium]|jgi:fatty-acyl-CoA synthase